MPAEPDRRADLADLLRSVGRALRRRGAALAEPFGLTLHQHRALRSVEQLDEPRIADLAAHMRIAPRSATEVVDDLERKELVRRMPHPADRRSVIVLATELGRQVLAELDELRRADAAELFAVLSDDDCQQLQRALTAIADEAARGEAARDEATRGER